MNDLLPANVISVNAQGIDKDNLNLLHDYLDNSTHDICPNCGGKNVNMRLMAMPIYNYLTRFFAEFYTIFRCNSKKCSKLSVHIFEAEVSQGWLMNGKWGDSFPISFDDEISISDADKIPPEVLSDYKEGLKCMQIKCYNAACVIFRRALETSIHILVKEQITDEKEIEDWFEKNKTLHNKINALNLEKGLKDFFHEIREIGNIGAHANDGAPATLEDAEEAHKFLSSLFEYKFIFPKKLRKSKKEPENSEN